MGDTDKYGFLLSDIQKIEEVLLPQLTELAEKIDASFAEAADTVLIVTDELANSKLFSKKTSGMIAAGGMLASAAIEAIGSDYSAYKYNKELDRILVEKQKIASAKKGSLEKILPLSLKQVDNISKVVNASLECTYPSEKLEDSSFRRTLYSNTEKEFSILRTSLYYFRMIEYLLEEYCAWEEGNHRSTLSQPVLFDTNKEIFDKYLYPEDPKDAFQILCSERSVISGREVACLADNQLMSVACLYAIFGEGKRTLEYDDSAFFDFWGNDKWDVTSNPDIISKGNNVIGYIDDVFNDQLEPVLEKGDGTWRFHLIFSILLILTVVTCVWLLDWAEWLRWAIGIIAGGIIVRIWRKLVVDAQFDYLSKLQKIIRGKIYDELKRKAGYKEIKNPDYKKKKSVIGSAMKLFD